LGEPLKEMNSAQAVALSGCAFRPDAKIVAQGQNGAAQKPELHLAPAEPHWPKVQLRRMRGFIHREV
jgi:hypothetical protein